MEHAWYVRSGNETFGPFDFTEARAVLAREHGMCYRCRGGWACDCEPEAIAYDPLKTIAALERAHPLRYA